jgi:hypothetical protein
VNSVMLIKATAVFGVGFLLDYGWTLWMRSVAQERPVQAALSSMAIGGLGLLGVGAFVVDPWTAFPYLVGLGVGTYVGVKR